MHHDLFRLDGKVALVTGASRGIGREIALLFAHQGASLVLCSRKQEDLESVAAKIAAAGGQAFAIKCHTGELAQIDALFEELRRRNLLPDILVNNAATNPHFGDVLTVDDKIWSKIVDVNLRGYFFLSQKAALAMKEKGGGVILNIASVNAVRPGVWQGVYSITKAGVVAMTKAFAKELAGSNIRVNALLPGLTDTKFAAALVKNQEILNLILPSIPLGRVAQPTEMAPAALYLVSPAAGYTTGACLPVDGGMLT
jgi:NAD(P)-dependent dehydrogenase (short-subunit alcohol dehydrogenase family)